MVYDRENLMFKNSSFNETEEAETILLKLSNADLENKLAEVEKACSEISSETGQIKQAIEKEQREKEFYLKKIQEIKDLCQRGIQHLAQLVEITTDVLKSTGVVEAETAKTKMRAVKPMIDGHVISKPTIKLNRVTEETVVRRYGQGGGQTSTSAFRSFRSTVGEAPSTSSSNNSNSPSRFPKSRQPLNTSYNGNHRETSENSEDQLDVEVQRISRNFNAGRAFTPSSSSAGSSSEGVLHNLFSPQSEAILSQASPILQTIESFERNSRQLNSRMETLRSNILKQFKVDTSKLRTQTPPTPQNVEKIVASTPRSQKKKNVTLSTSSGRVNKKSSSKTVQNPRVLLKRMNLTPKSSVTPRNRSLSKRTTSSGAKKPTAAASRKSKTAPKKNASDQKSKSPVKTKATVKPKQKKVTIKKSPKIKLGKRSK